MTGSIFASLTEEQRREAFAGLVRRRYGEGELVLHEGGPPDAMYVIEAGRAEVFTTGADGVHRLVARLEAGDTIGEISMLTGSPVSATVRAVTAIDVIQLTADDLRRLGQRFPVLFQNLATMLAERLRRRR